MTDPISPACTVVDRDLATLANLAVDLRHLLSDGDFLAAADRVREAGNLEPLVDRFIDAESLGDAEALDLIFAVGDLRPALGALADAEAELRRALEAYIREQPVERFLVGDDSVLGEWAL